MCIKALDFSSTLSLHSTAASSLPGAFIPRQSLHVAYGAIDPRVGWNPFGQPCQLTANRWTCTAEQECSLPQHLHLLYSIFALSATTELLLHRIEAEAEGVVQGDRKFCDFRHNTYSFHLACANYHH